MKLLAQSKNKNGFTLIELLVVIAIIAILAAILFPVFQSVRENARRSAALSNCKQLMTAIVQYTQDGDEHLPMGGSNFPNAPVFTEWQEAIYPFVKSEKAYMDPDDNQAQDDNDYASNPSMINRGGGTVAATSFLMNFTATNNPSSAAGRSSTGLADYTSPSNYILLMTGNRASSASVGNRYAGNNMTDHNGKKVSIWGEQYVLAGVGDTRHMFDQCTNSSTNPELTGLPFHKAGVIFGFLDGHVKFITCSANSPAPVLEYGVKLPYEQYGYPNDQANAIGSHPWNIDASCGR